MQSEVLHCTWTIEIYYTIVDNSKTNFVESKSIDVALDTIFWNLYFYGSNWKECASVGSILMVLKGNRISMAIRMEFAWTNNTTKYELLLQGLWKEVDLKVKNIKLYGDSKIVAKSVHNTIHCNSNHLQLYQYEVWMIIN